jgi:hypothetical protein
MRGQERDDRRRRESARANRRPSTPCRGQGAAAGEHIALVGGDFDVLLVRTESNAALRDLVLVELQGMPEVLSTRTMLVFEESDGLGA